MVAAAFLMYSWIELVNDTNFFCILGFLSRLLLGSGYIFLQILISLNSSIGYWQLFFGSLSGNDASCPKPDVHWSFLTGGRGRRCIMNCDSLSPDKPQSIWRVKGASCLPSKSWFCQDSLIADEEAQRKRWCWEEWGRHLLPSPQD